MMKSVNNILRVEGKDSKYDVDTDAGRFEMAWLDQNVVRLRTQWDQKIAPDQSYVLQESIWNDRLDALFDDREKIAPFVPEMAETETKFRFDCSDYDVEIGKTAWHFSIRECLTGEWLHEDLWSGWIEDQLGRLQHLIRRRENDLILGLGEKSGVLDRTGRRLKLHNQDAAWYDAEFSDPLYKHIPFFIRKSPDVSFAVGYFYHNAYPAEFDFGAEQSIYKGEHIKSVFDGGTPDLFLIIAPTIRKVVTRFIKLTGLPPFTPRFSLGYLGSTMYYTELPERSDLAIEGFIDECRRVSIPISVFHMSSGYTLGNDGKRYVFTWNEDRFPDPAEFMAKLNERDIELSPNIKPAILASHPQFNAFKQQDVFIKSKTPEAIPLICQFWGGEAAFFDFSNPRARSLWADCLRRALISYGCVSIWNDNNEFELYYQEGFVDGDGTAQDVNGIRPMLANLMAKTAYDAVIAVHPNRRPFILSRSGFAGLQHYAHTWSGDNMTEWKTLRFNIATMLGSSLSGLVFNGMDLGGFDGPAPEPELLVRWVQNGVFHPRFCIHSWNSDNTVTEPWMYPEVFDEVRSAIQRRYWLLPYLYTLAEQAHRTGALLVRPMVYEFEEDEQVWQESFTFMLGDAILVPPVVYPGQREVNVYLPKNSTWLDIQSGQHYRGGQTVKLSAPLDQYPFLLRGGCVVVVDTGFGLSENAPLEILISAFQDGSGEVYFDDGVSFDYRQGQFKRINFQFDGGINQLSVEWACEGHYQPGCEFVMQVFLDTNCPSQVKLNDSKMQHYLYLSEFEAIETGWYFDIQRKAVIIKTKESVFSANGKLMMQIPHFSA
jgi:alpha-glucosidase